MLVKAATLSLAEMYAGSSAPLARDGAAAFDGTGELLAIEADGNWVLVIDARSGSLLSKFAAGVSQVRALALKGGPILVAVGSRDGGIALHSVGSGAVLSEMTVGMRTLATLAFSPDGNLLAAGDSDGNVIVCRIFSDEEPRRIATGEPVSAIAVPDLGFPVLAGGPDGQIRVLRRALPRTKLGWSGAAVTSLAFPAQSTGGPLAGRADGKVHRIDPTYHRLSLYVDTGTRPVPALWAGSQGQVKALTGDGRLCAWTSEDEAPALLSRMPEELQKMSEQFQGWCRELYQLVSAFSEVREQMRDKIAAERAEMLDELDEIDAAERERIRPIVVESAVSIFDSYAFDLTLRRIAMANPLPAALIALVGVMALLMLSSTKLVSGLGALHGVGSWFALLGVVGALAWIIRALGRIGVPGRVLRVVLVAVGVGASVAGPEVALSVPDRLRALTSPWLPAAASLRIKLAIPYPVWLSTSYVVWLAVAFAVARLLYSHLRAPDARALRRRVLGDALLHALLDVAYQAHIMADDAQFAAWPFARVKLHNQVRMAARIASREWVAGMRTRAKRTDRIIRDQGNAIATAIMRWERPAALAGAQLPKVSCAFATAVVNAADNDWAALAGSTAPALNRRRRAWRLVGQALSLAVLLGTAAGIGFGIHPLPTALGSLLAFLVGLAVARVLRWLDLDTDIDPGLALSDLLRKPS